MLIIRDMDVAALRDLLNFQIPNESSLAADTMNNSDALVREEGHTSYQTAATRQHLCKFVEVNREDVNDSDFNDGERCLAMLRQAMLGKTVSVTLLTSVQCLIKVDEWLRSLSILAN